MRREFFNVTPHEVKDALLELQGSVLTFRETVEALEWHQSQSVFRQLNAIPALRISAPG